MEELTHLGVQSGAGVCVDGADRQLGRVPPGEPWRQIDDLDAQSLQARFTRLAAVFGTAIDFAAVRCGAPGGA